MFPILKCVPILFELAGAGAVSDEVVVLRRNAQELLRQSQPSKALALLQRAREIDSLQADIDHMMNQCRAKMGVWVASDAGADWNEGEDAAQSAVKRNPDSMYRVGQRLAQSENLPAAMRLFQFLSRAPAPKPEYLKAYTELRARQDGLVAFHRDLAERAVLRGALSEVLEERRNAFSACPDDPSLRLEVERAEQSVQISRQAFWTSLNKSLANRDATGATAIVAKARVAHPEDTGFKRLEDSLLTTKKALLAGRLTEIDSMVEAGRIQDAMDAMESLRGSFPEEAGLMQAQDALRERIVRKRRRMLADSLGSIFDRSMALGDLPAAQSILETMRAKGISGQDVARLGTRIDSVRSRERSAGLSNEAVANARKALVRADTASAREWSQKALSIQPDNALARGILAGLVAQQKSTAQKKPPRTESVTTSAAQGAKVSGLVMAGISAYRAGDYKSAMERWKEALAIDPSCVQAERYLANVGRKQARLQ